MHLHISETNAVGSKVVIYKEKNKIFMGVIKHMSNEQIEAFLDNERSAKTSSPQPTK